MKTLDRLALLLVIVGALNWGLIGLFNVDLVAALLGSGSALSRIVYTLVGVSGVWLAISAVTRQASGTPGMANDH